MFKEHPELRNFFNQTNQKTGKQPVALAQTVCYFVDNRDSLDVMIPQMRRVSSKHRTITVKPEHYPIVGKYLLQAIIKYMGDKATLELMAAWQAVYDMIKDAIISGPTYSITLERNDSGKLFDYHSGQYVTLRVEKDSILHHGHYPLVNTYDGNSYTVAFKQGNGLDQNSIVSEEMIRNYHVGSTILLPPPAGSFALAKDAKRHLFVSGGIGITSFMAIIQELNQQGKAGSVSLTQCVQTEEHAAIAGKLHRIL
ncbi:unnamed protein product [Rotaria sp. Silwood2]|nr:unnamed protein product [Rotaria sp. Silwood2]CAF4524681.1 unnamed protein product [Rotaria sp. Silwood2]